MHLSADLYRICTYVYSGTTLNVAVPISDINESLSRPKLIKKDRPTGRSGSGPFYCGTMILPFATTVRCTFRPYSSETPKGIVIGGEVTEVVPMDVYTVGRNYYWVDGPVMTGVNLIYNTLSGEKRLSFVQYIRYFYQGDIDKRDPEKVREYYGTIAGNSSALDDTQFEYEYRNALHVPVAGACTLKEISDYVLHWIYGPDIPDSFQLKNLWWEKANKDPEYHHVYNRTRYMDYYITDPRYKIYSFLSAPPKAELCFSEKHNEFRSFCFMWGLDVFMAPYARGFQTAYVDAAKNLPKAANNSLANLVEAIQVLKTIPKIVKNPRKGLAKLAEYVDPRKAWLAYRYMYTTTKLDVAEYQKAWKALSSLLAMSGQDIKANGQWRDGDFVYRASISVNADQIIPKDVSQWLRVAGFNPNLTNMWDMVPYSFVVDWFFGISDFTSLLDSWADSIKFVPSEVWYSASISYEYENHFFRVEGRRLTVPPALVTGTTSNRTISMRIGDALSLFTH